MTRAKGVILKPEVVLSLVPQGVTVCEFAQIHEGIEQIVGAPVWTHQIVMIGRAVMDHVAAQCPRAVEIMRDLGSPPKGDVTDWLRRAHECATRLGDVEIAPMRGVDVSTPIADAVELLGPDKVVVVKAKVKP